MMFSASELDTNKYDGAPDATRAGGEGKAGKW